MNYDVVIAYRCYPKTSKHPFKRADDKLAMICGGLQSLCVCLGTLKAKIYIIDDGCPPEREANIKNSVGGFAYEYIKTPRIGNFGTFGKQLEILTEQNDAKYVYFAEDDYIYTNHGFDEGLQLLSQGEADFVTLFDHKGYYTEKHHAIKPSYILHTQKRIWKRVNSTCMTFMTTRKTLQETKAYWEKYTRGVRDYPLRLGLTKYNLFSVFNIDWNYKDRLYKNLHVPATWLHTAMVWIKCWKQILLGKRYTLYAPVPSIATHLETADKAPLVDR